MKKKILGLFLVFAMMATMISGCSQAPQEGAEAESTQAAEPAGELGKKVEGTVTYNVDMSGYDKGKVVKLWLPVAKTIDYQTVEEATYDAKATKVEMNEDELGNKMLYVEWDANAEPADRKVTCSFDATRNEVLRPELKEEGEVGSDMEEYLKGTEMVVVTGEVKKLADEITEGETTYLGKARKVYDWIIANMNRDNSVRGCGLGDVPVLLSTKAGKCTDINSVFVALCRAAGVPAREMFGIRMNADDITKNQHCWAEFYLPGTGWVLADPADVLKAVLTNEWDKEAQETKDLQEYYFGGADAERVELSRGRDLTLSPKQDEKPLNNFGYPYAEVDGEVIDFYEPEEFIYTISFKAK